jgi:hypothetical protein
MYKDLNNETQFKPLNDWEGLSFEQKKANHENANLIRAGLVASLGVRVGAAKEDLELILQYLEAGDTVAARKAAEWSLGRTERVIDQANAEYATIYGYPLINP